MSLEQFGYYNSMFGMGYCMSYTGFGIYRQDLFMIIFGIICLAANVAGYLYWRRQ